MPNQTDIVICGAGITGVSAAYSLAKAGIKNILLVDERPPLSFTSDRSSECYRNWWSDPAMLGLMNRSIDLMEELADKTGNIFNMNRRGYLFVNADETQLPGLIERSKRTSDLLAPERVGAGGLRIHTPETSTYQPVLRPGSGQAPLEDFHNQPDGADLLMGSNLIQKHFPYLTEKAVAALHVRRAGWLSAQQLGRYLYETARSLGVRFESARVTGVDVKNNRVTGVRLGTGERIDTSIFINAAGPYLEDVGQMLGLELPVFTELHLKASMRDSLGVVSRDAPLLIWNDPQSLPWTGEERDFLTEDPETTWLTEPFPAHVHTRPEGAGDSQTILMLWDYQENATEVVWPPPLDKQFPEIALRGLAAMLPGMQAYFEKMPRPQLDGGYYTKTRENRPLVGPLPLEGAFVTGAVSGYGIMSACAVGELLACHVTGTTLPANADAFVFSRYEDPNYLKKLETWGDSEQL